MPKVKVNCDTIGNNILPKTDTVIANIQSAYNASGSIDYPYGEFDWSSIRGEVENCLNNMKRYKSTMMNIQETFSNTLTNMTDDITGIKVSKIISSQSIVK